MHPSRMTECWADITNKCTRWERSRGEVARGEVSGVQGCGPLKSPQKDSIYLIIWP